MLAIPHIICRIPFFVLQAIMLPGICLSSNLNISHLCLCLSLSVFVCLCLSLSVFVSLCLYLSVFVCLCLSLYVLVLVCLGEERDLLRKLIIEMSLSKSFEEAKLNFWESSTECPTRLSLSHNLPLKPNAHYPIRHLSLAALESPGKIVSWFQ